MTCYGFACQTANSAAKAASPKLVLDAKRPSFGGTARTQPAVASAPRTSRSDKQTLLEVADKRTARTRSETPIGQTGSLISLGDVDPLGRWVYFCQSTAQFDKPAFASGAQGARSAFLGQGFSPHFAQVNTEATPTEALLASSPDGRYVVLSRNQEPELVDVETGAVTSLSSRDIDMRADVFPGDHRSIAFSPMSDRLALLVHQKQPRVAILNLRDSSEVEVIPLSAVIWRIAFDASGRYLVLREVPEDTNHNGKVTWPFPERQLADTRCRTRIPAFPAFSPNGDEAQTSVAPIAGGKAHWVPGFLTGLGRSIVVKAANGALSAVEGARLTGFGSGDCDAQVVAIAPEHERILVGCRDKSGRAQLELDGLSTSLRLELDVPNSNIDTLVPESNPFTVVYSGAHTSLIEWASARVFALQDRDQVLAQGEAGVVIRRGTQLVLHTPSSNRSVPLLDNVSSGARIVFGSGVVVVGNAVVSARLGRVVGTLGKPTLAVDPNGCGLVSLSESKNELFAVGPLGWQCPQD